MSHTILMNSFQTPNHFVDTAMAMLTPEEYKCLSFATRHILGWQDKINKRRGFISLTMFERGYISSKGMVFGGTGLTRPTIIRATDELTRLRFLLKIGEPTNDGQEWELGEEPDFDALEARYQSRKDARRGQTSKARQSAQGGKANIPPTGGLSDIPEVVKPTDQKESVPQTSGGMSDILNQIHSKDTLQSQSKNTEGDSISLNAKEWKTSKQMLEIQLNQNTFMTWIKDVEYLREEAGNVWVFQAPTTFARDYLQHRLMREIKRVVRDVHGSPVELVFESAVSA